jgi:hypothetical protein
MDATGGCPNQDRCELFPRIQADPALKSHGDNYCHGEFRRCARYKDTEDEFGNPPSDLLPNGRRLAYLATGTTAQANAEALIAKAP